ncbi:hypothetical protein I4U23_003505 [Adineta vaga]|nr:hypothetical protein I4U23_003505 [Adineta vaga]
MFQIFILFLLLQSSIHSLPLVDDRINHAGRALNALQHLLNFFENDAQNINVDGVFCLRIAQHQINALHQVIISSTQLTDKNHFIQSLSIQIDRIANKSITEISRTGSFYYQRFSYLLSREFIIEYQSRKLDKSFIENNQETKDSFFDTELSDRCFGELLGSNNFSISSQCSISDLCWNKMTIGMTKNYRLTHQLLWALIAKNLHCNNTQLFSNQSEKNHPYLENFFCANIYEDANFNLINHINQDLFLEQLLLCSTLGYEEFLRFDWLDTILTWQHPKYACFSNTSEIIQSTQLTKRHLLTEKVMTNECLSHKSGLAAGLLATYARVFFTMKD